jgi:hypothetical protein
MKALVRLTLPLIVFFLMIIPVIASATPIEVVASRYKNLFVFTTQKKMRGGEVKVFYSNGDLITTQQLKKRKMIIDFCDVKSGAYTIVVQKGNKTETFQYVRQ